MRVFFVSLLALPLLAMAPARPAIPDPAATTQIEPYHQRFRQLSAQFGGVIVARSVSFSFTSFIGSTVGLCTMNGSGNNRVALSSSAWNRGSDTFKEMLSFHELGHCLLGRGHKNSTHSDGRPESLMASRLFSERAYLANRDQYLKELFTAERGRQLATRVKIGSFDDDCDW